MTKKMQGNLMLLITAFIWGTAFVAQKQGAGYIGPFTFNTFRNLTAGLSVLALILLWPYIMRRPMEADSSQKRAMTLKGGMICGLILTAAMGFQQIGIVYTKAGKAGFITALYIVLVPMTGIFFGRKIPLRIWICVALATIGLYLLSIKGGFTISKGDFLILLSTLCYAGHILVIDYFSRRSNGVKMSMIQFFVAAALSVVIVLILKEPVALVQIKKALFSILYVGVLSSGVGYTFQIMAQRYTEPTTASLIMSLESVFSVIAGAIVLGESLTFRELAGFIIMFLAIILAQLPSKKIPFERKSR